MSVCWFESGCWSESIIYYKEHWTCRSNNVLLWLN